jgi:hypothetical protein
MLERTASEKLAARDLPVTQASLRIDTGESYEVHYKVAVQAGCNELALAWQFSRRVQVRVDFSDEGSRVNDKLRYRDYEPIGPSPGGLIVCVDRDGEVRLTLNPVHEFGAGGLGTWPRYVLARGHRPESSDEVRARRAEEEKIAAGQIKALGRESDARQEERSMERCQSCRAEASECTAHKKSFCAREFGRCIQRANLSQSQCPL